MPIVCEVVSVWTIVLVARYFFSEDWMEPILKYLSYNLSSFASFTADCCQIRAQDRAA